MPWYKSFTTVTHFGTLVTMLFLHWVFFLLYLRTSACLAPPKLSRHLSGSLQLEGIPRLAAAFG
ncbi:hypothetical protein WG66_013657, partial [Moniliophthora roreri]